MAHGGITDEAERIVPMNKSLRHRGPDHEGNYTSDKIALGHQRLSIIDLSNAANQPFVSPDKRYSMVYNGEVYNYKKLKSELDFPFKTNSDTEVVLAAYMKWGAQCLNRFNGMFALAIWDDVEKELFVARDRMGIKPLYYYSSDTHFVFSSEIRSVLASGLVKKELDKISLIDYLRYQTVHAPGTIIKDVKMLLPGHYMKIREDEMVHKCYWDISTRPKTINAEGPEVHKEVKKRLYSSVEERLVSDVPLGAFLSGGIDSSAIVGIMSEVNPGKTNTFSVSFDEEEYSEAPYAKKVADKFNTQHHDIRLRADDFLKDLPAAIEAMDHPSGDGPNTFVVSQATKKEGITVALSGLGGDELFAGYDVFERIKKLEGKKWMLSFPKFMRSIGGSMMRSVNPGVQSDKLHDIITQDYFDIEYVYPVVRQVLMDREVQQLTGMKKLPPNHVRKITAELLEYGKPGFELSPLSRISVAEISSYMQNVLLRDTDQMSMAHALEVRVPFLDHHLVEYVLGVSDAIKYPYSPKKLLTDSLPGLLPEDIVHRPKMGFVLPWDKWMKNELKGFCEDGLDKLKEIESIDSGELDKLWQRFLQGDNRLTWSRLWPMVVLGNWIKNNGIEG